MEGSLRLGSVVSSSEFVMMIMMMMMMMKSCLFYSFQSRAIGTGNWRQKNGINNQ